MFPRRMHGIYKDIDRSKEETESNKEFDELDKLKELGDAFIEDKKKLELEYARIESSTILDSKHKAEQLRRLKLSALELQEDYDKRVTEEQKVLQEKQKERLEKLETGSEELEQEIESLISVKMEVAVTNTDGAVDAVKEEKDKFDQLIAGRKLKLELSIQQAEIQRREMMKDILSDM